MWQFLTVKIYLKESLLSISCFIIQGKVLQLPQTSKETPCPIDGPITKYSSGCLIPTIIAYCTGYVWAIASQIEKKNTSRSANYHFNLYIIQSNTPRVDHWQVIWRICWWHFILLSVSHINVYWSDCRTNFVGAQEYLREIMHSWVFPKIQSTHSEKMYTGYYTAARRYEFYFEW